MLDRIKAHSRINVNPKFSGIKEGLSKSVIASGHPRLANSRSSLAVLSVHTVLLRSNAKWRARLQGSYGPEEEEEGKKKRVWSATVGSTRVKGHGPLVSDSNSSWNLLSGGFSCQTSSFQEGWLVPTPR